MPSEIQKHPILNCVSQLDRGLSTSTWAQLASYADTACFVLESLARRQNDKKSHTATLRPEILTGRSSPCKPCTLALSMPKPTHLHRCLVALHESVGGCGLSSIGVCFHSPYGRGGIRYRGRDTYGSNEGFKRARLSTVRTVDVQDKLYPGSKTCLARGMRP